MMHLSVRVTTGTMAPLASFLAVFRDLNWDVALF